MKLNQLRKLCSQQLRQLCVALAGQVHEIHLVELAVLCVQKVHALTGMTPVEFKNRRREG